MFGGGSGVVGYREGAVKCTCYALELVEVEELGTCLGWDGLCCG